MPNSVFLKVKGRPRPWQEAKVIAPWCKVIADKAKQNEPNCFGGLSQAKFKVVVTFWMADPSEGGDLDNLVIPVLNTLFTPRPGQQQEVQAAERLFDANDKQVMELIGQKKQARPKTDEGVDIYIAWE